MSIEKRAIKLAGTTALILIIIKITIGIVSGSIVVLTSGIDSLLDFFVSLMNFFALKKSEEKPDEKHNYGHGKIEGFGALFEGFLIFLSGFFIILFSINKIISKNLTFNITESLLVMIISISLTGGLVLYLSKITSKTNSLILKADMLHYKVDLYTNLGIILSLIIMKIFNFPIIDPIISIGIALYIIFQSINIIKEGINMLMDHKIEDGSINLIKKTILSYPEIIGFHCLRTRKSGKNVFIEFHIVFKDENILLKDAHEISNKIENDIKININYSEVLIHLDYYDDSNNIF